MDVKYNDRPLNIIKLFVCTYLTPFLGQLRENKEIKGNFLPKPKTKAKGKITPNDQFSFPRLPLKVVTCEGVFSIIFVLIYFKVRIFWEGHKASNFKWKIFSNFVAFSEYPNFMALEHREKMFRNNRCTFNLRMLI